MKNRLFVDHLTVLDFSFLHPKRGIVGESWIMDVELYGELDDQGMVFDFGDVKKRLKQAAEGLVDHKFVVPTQLDGLEISEEPGDRVALHYEFADGCVIDMSAPADAVAALETEAVAIETLQPILNRHLSSCVPPNVSRVDVRLRQEVIQGAYYHYSHGLKKHQGNCQRIAHGHRSRLEIHADGQRSQLTEYQWAKRWRDIYIGTREDLCEERLVNDQPHCHFRYVSAQGLFSLTLPKRQVYLIDTETTVEFIAEHIAQTLKRQRPQNHFKVKAFEGVMKGAIAEI